MTASRTSDRALKALSPLSLVVLWQIAVGTNFLNPGLFPPPTAIAANFVDYAASGDLATDAQATLWRLFVGLFIGGIPGTLLGLGMGMSRWVRAYFEPVVGLLYPIPKIAILPLFYFLFGAGDAAKSAAVAVGVFFLMTINTEAGVRQIETIYLDVARAYRIRPTTFFFKVLLPGALPNVFAGAKLSIGLGIVLAVAAEYQLTRTGLGFAIYNAQQLLVVDRMYAAIVAVSLLGFGLAALLDAGERLVMPWRTAGRRTARG